MKFSWDMNAMLGVVLMLALSAAPQPAGAIITPLNAPKTSATYHLALKDPPVNVILIDWYCTDADLWREIKNIYDNVKEGFDLIGEDEGEIRALENLRRLKKMAAPGWPMTEPSMHISPLKKGLDAPPGGRKVYTFKYCATGAELLIVRKTVMTYLRAVLDTAVQAKKKEYAAEKTLTKWLSDPRHFPYSHTIIVTVIRDGVPDRRMTIKPVWQPKDKSAGGRKRKTVHRPSRQLTIKPIKPSDRNKDCNYYAAYDDCSACGADEICLAANIKDRPLLNCFECAPKERPLGGTGRQSAKRKPCGSRGSRKDRNITGTYTGGLKLRQTGRIVTGTYENGKGSIRGTLRGNRLIGTFVRSDYSPPTKGRFEFHFSKDRKSFTGSWRNTSVAGSGSWNGRKTTECPR